MMTATVQNRREEAVRQYMLGWQTGDEALLAAPLSSGIRIVESHGPVYEGISEVRTWFREWRKAGRVIRWDALRFWHQGDETVVKWYFRCSYQGVEDGFDGLSLIRFDQDGLIASMEEYQAKTERFRPFATSKIQY